MYVCLCNGISDREIKRSIRDGARTLDDLRDNLGVASQCGQCACLTEELLEQQLECEFNGDLSLPYAAA